MRAEPSNGTKDVTPQVSVVMPVRNGAAFIEEAVRSVLSQPGIAIEVVVIDDGSSDGTREVVTAIEDHRVRLLTNPAGGVSSARNHGIRKAEGGWILFLDADDRLAPGGVSRLLEASTPDAIVVYGDYDRIDLVGRRVGLRHLIRRRRKPTGDVLEAIVGANFIAVGCGLFRRQSLLALDGFDQSLHLCEDWLLWCRLAATGPFVYVPNRHIVDYRIHRGSTMHRRARTFAEFAPVLDRIFDDELIASRLDPARVSALRTRAEESLRSYVTTEAMRVGAWPLAVGELVGAVRRAPRSLPRLTFRLAASMVGL